MHAGQAKIGPLRAADPQGMAPGHQLRAADHRLRAADHPLRTAGRPLRAADRPLRAADRSLTAGSASRMSTNGPITGRSRFGVAGRF